MRTSRQNTALIRSIIQRLLISNNKLFNIRQQEYYCVIDELKCPYIHTYIYPSVHKQIIRFEQKKPRETTRTSSNYVDEDYPARPEIKQSLPGWGDNCGSESSTLETDICVWRYAPLVVLATQEEKEELASVVIELNLVYEW